MNCKNCNTYNSVGASNCINCGVFLNIKYKVKKIKPIELNVDNKSKQRIEFEANVISSDTTDLKDVLSYIESDSIASEKSDFQDAVFNLITKKSDKKNKQNKTLDESSTIAYEQIKPEHIINNQNVQFNSYVKNDSEDNQEIINNYITSPVSVDNKLGEKEKDEIISFSIINNIRSKITVILKSFLKFIEN